MKFTRNCEGANRHKVEFNGASLDMCPVRWRRELEAEMLLWSMAAPFINHNVLPFSGGFMEQPAPIVDALNLIENELNGGSDNDGR